MSSFLARDAPLSLSLLAKNIAYIGLSFNLKLSNLQLSLHYTYD